MKKFTPIIIVASAILASCTTVIVESPDNQEQGTIAVVSGTYGKNCGTSEGNVTEHLADQCNGLNTCSYTVHHKTIGDPAYGCRKNYIARFKCSESGKTKTIHVPEEAGFGSVATLSCR